MAVEAITIIEWLFKNQVQVSIIEFLFYFPPSYWNKPVASTGKLNLQKTRCDTIPLENYTHRQNYAFRASLSFVHFPMIDENMREWEEKNTDNSISSSDKYANMLIVKEVILD